MALIDAFPYTPTYTDPDSPLVSVTDVGTASLPAWVTLDPATGTLDGTPPVSGTTTVTGPHKLRFYDGTNNVDSNEFFITVPGVAGTAAFDEPFEFVGGWNNTTSARASLDAATEQFNEPFEFAGGWNNTTSARASLASAVLAFDEPFEYDWDGTPTAPLQKFAISNGLTSNAVLHKQGTANKDALPEFVHIPNIFVSRYKTANSNLGGQGSSSYGVGNP